MKTSWIAWTMLTGLYACGPRVHVVTATSVGMKVTSATGESSTPSVDFGYKRSEIAIVPVAEDERDVVVGGTSKSDAYSVFAAFDFDTNWLSETAITQVIATGFAAQSLTSTDAPKSPGSESVTRDSAEQRGAQAFGAAFREAATGIDDASTAKRRASLLDAIRKLDDREVESIRERRGVEPQEHESGRDALERDARETRATRLGEFERDIQKRSN